MPHLSLVFPQIKSATTTTTMRMLIALVTLSLVGYSSAQVFGFGPCPDVRPVENLDFERWAGRWYEIARFYNAPEESVSCQTTNFTLADGYILANESGLNATGRPYWNAVPIYRARDDNSGILYFASETPGEFTVSFVDYERYGMTHVCNEYLWGFINVQYNWIFARERQLSEGEYQDAMRFLAAQGINVRKFRYANQRDCPIFSRERPE